MSKDTRMRNVNIHHLSPDKGTSVWFPVENGVERTDPWSLHADPMNGYVKSIDENGIIEVDIRQVYKRVYASNIFDESRKMITQTGMAYVNGKYCFTNRRDCMDCIESMSFMASSKPEFRANVVPLEADFADAIASISETELRLEQ